MLIAALLLLSATSSNLRGAALVPVEVSSGQKLVVPLDKDTLHIETAATLGSCAYSESYVRELRNPLDTSRFRPFPGDSAKMSYRAFARIGWSDWSLITPGAACKTSVGQDPGGLRFRSRQQGDFLVLMDTVFHRIADTASVAGYRYHLVVDVQARWLHAPYDPKRKWVRWLDSLDFIRGKTRPYANHPFLTLTDSLAVDSIAPVMPDRNRSWHLLIDAVAPSGKRWNFDLHKPHDATASGTRGTGVKLPPGTTFRFQGFMEDGSPVDRFRTLVLWSGGKPLDSLVANPTGILIEKVVRSGGRGAGTKASASFDLSGRRLPASSALSPHPGGQVLQDRGHTSILFGK